MRTRFRLSAALALLVLGTSGSASAQGPFVCTEVIGMMTTGEWYNAGFETTLGAELGTKWQGRFAHYGYVTEYAKPGSYAWSATPVGGVNNVSLTAPCIQNANAPDRIVYQAWSWELTSEEADTAFARVAANHPGLVTVAPRFAAHACPAKIDGIHLGDQNRAVATDIGTHYKALL